MSDSDARAEMSKISRRSFLWAGAALIGTYGGFRFLATRHEVDGLPWPMRRALNLNEDVWMDAFSKAALAPTFDPKERSSARLNGTEGMNQAFDPTQWSLRVENVFGMSEPLSLTLDDIKALPRHEFTTRLCCIEGWSIIVTWAGTRFSDFARRYLPPATSQRTPSIDRHSDLAPFVYLATPGEGYYVGIDMASMLHPQTLLCYEMNGQPLTLEHGAPLRLVIPVKYGIKNLKRIGLIRYASERPADFWAEQGYDWYAGL